MLSFMLYFVTAGNGGEEVVGVFFQLHVGCLCDTKILESNLIRHSWNSGECAISNVIGIESVL